MFSPKAHSNKNPVPQVDRQKLLTLSLMFEHVRFSCTNVHFSCTFVHFSLSSLFYLFPRKKSSERMGVGGGPAVVAVAVAIALQHVCLVQALIEPKSECQDGITSDALFAAGSFHTCAVRVDHLCAGPGCWGRPAHRTRAAANATCAGARAQDERKQRCLCTRITRCGVCGAHPAADGCAQKQQTGCTCSHARSAVRTCTPAIQ